LSFDVQYPTPKYMDLTALSAAMTQCIGRDYEEKKAIRKAKTPTRATRVRSFNQRDFL
jgi:hypothetical protein